MAQPLAPGMLQDDAAAAGEEGKMTQDFTAAVSSLIQRIKDVSKEGAATAASSATAVGLFEEVFSLEKKCRQTNDSSSGARLCCFYLQLLADACFLCMPRSRKESGEGEEISAAAETVAKVEAAAAAAAERVAAKAAAEARTESSEGLVLGTPEATRAAAAAAMAAAGAKGSVTLSYLCEQLLAICKKRGQLKRTIIEVVKQAMRWLPRLPQKQQKIELIEALKKVTAGKIFVEVDRARLILLLAEMKEAEGKIDEAAHLLQEVQVETYGAMETREKTEYILKQMELVLRKGDYIRCQIISKKINQRLLASDESLQDLKIQFYRHMVAYYMHEDLTLDCCKAFYSIFHTPSVQQNKKEWKLSLQCYILFMLLAPFDDEVKQLAEAVKRDEAKKLKEMPVFLELLRDMTKTELMDWPLPYEAELKKHPVFQDKPIHPGGEARWQLLRRRALQHNIRVMGTYYSRVHMDRVASLLRITRDEVEAEISELVCLNFLHAKMDRPAGTVEFGMKKSTFDRLNAWARDVSKVLEKVDLCSHLIQRERMVHAARARNAALMARHAS